MSHDTYINAIFLRDADTFVNGIFPFSFYWSDNLSYHHKEIDKMKQIKAHPNKDK
jgi:hypothetical protein